MFLGSKLNFTVSSDNEIDWLKGVPPDKPACGYTGELCIERKYIRLLNGNYVNSKIVYCLFIKVFQCRKHRMKGKPLVNKNLRK